LAVGRWHVNDATTRRRDDAIQRFERRRDSE
jgi:hypothetical protein